MKDNQDKADHLGAVTYGLDLYTPRTLVIPELWSPLDDDTFEDQVNPMMATTTNLNLCHPWVLNYYRYLNTVAATSQQRP